ncbi:MAG: gluconate 2-dehydrogenase subunit 3 family protein [Deltaproteobacteria bacterium]|nr:gluconate 2-dehydrogenase subunit 3 family protein [Deltaproteobacteria bacterium]
MDLVFDSHQRATIAAATARIIPTDQDAGALEAGVIEYIERALAGYAKRSTQLYYDGVLELNRLARERFRAETFIALAPEEQDEILRSLEKAASRFFAVLLEHTMEGFYGDPRHGGNKNRVGWKMIGFPGPSFPKGYEPPLGWYDADEPNEFGSAKKR